MVSTTDKLWFLHPAILCRVHTHSLHAMILVEANLELVHDCFASSSDILPSAKHVK
jgi:hypothetical protein